LGDQFDDLNISSRINLKKNAITETAKAYKPLFDLVVDSNAKCVPAINRVTVNKTTVLKKAIEAGILIPESIVCNHKSDLVAFKEKHGRIITKPLGEVIVAESNSHVYTSKTVEITDADIAGLESVFFPSFF